jgi:hypothetical protein
MVDVLEGLREGLVEDDPSRGRLDHRRPAVRTGLALGRLVRHGADGLAGETDLDHVVQLDGLGVQRHQHLVH